MGFWSYFKSILLLRYVKLSEFKDANIYENEESEKDRRKYYDIMSFVRYKIYVIF